MSASNYDGRPDDDDLYYSGDEEIYSTVGIDQTHTNVPVSRHDENRTDVRASDSEVRGIWIRRAKGRVSSTTTKFVRSYILRGNTASSHATVSYLPVKSNSVVPRKFDYMTVPDLTQFIKKDQNIQGDSNRFDFTTAELEYKEDALPTDPGESSTDSQKNKVPFPWSNLSAEIRRIDMSQSEGRISSQAATAPIDQSERGIYKTSDKSEAVRAQLICYKRRCRDQFVSCAPRETESRTLDATNSTLRNTVSNSIDFLENCARPPSSSFLRRITSNSLWLAQNSRRILRKRIRPRKHLIYLLRVICAVIRLCSGPIIVVICSSTMGSSGMALLQLLRALMLGIARRSTDIEPDSDD